MTNPGIAVAWAFLKRFWPFAIIIALVFVVLFQRTAVIKAEADTATVKTELAGAKEANEHNTQLIDRFHMTREQNDAVILDLLEQQRLAGQRSDKATTIIKEAIRNDPATRDWADTPLPDSVRRALNPSEPND